MVNGLKLWNFKNVYLTPLLERVNFCCLLPSTLLQQMHMFARAYTVRTYTASLTHHVPLSRPCESDLWP